MPHKEWRQALALTLAVLQITQPLSNAAHAAGVAPRTAGVTLNQAANGVPIVNIAAPGAAGVSHNSYAQFDVGTNGLIFNNSAQPVNTQLGGFIPGNAHMGGGAARLILNEVTSANPSQLNGYMEVAGQKAGVVVANPYGITCRGCGFINTSKATLSTGTPFFNSDGSLGGFNVENGTLRIDGDGLNASNTDRLALYSRVLELNAALYAKNLQVVTGTNHINAVTGVATASGSTSPAPVYAIDSSALGGMYANTISLRGTEAGVGMRLAGPVGALTGKLEILSNGDVRLAHASAQTDQTITAQGQLTLDDKVGAGGNVKIKAEGITLASGAAIAAANGLSINANQLRNAGEIDVTEGLLTIDLAGTFDNHNGTLRHGGNIFTLTADGLDNSDGTLASEGIFTLQLKGNDALDNSRGLLQGNAALNIKSTGLNSASGQILGNGLIDLDLGNGALDNSANGLIESSGSITLNNVSALQNASGTFRAGQNLTLNLPAFDRALSGGNYSAVGLLAIHTAGDISFTGAEFATPGGLLLDAGTADIEVYSRVLSGGDTSISGNSLTMGDIGFLATQGSLTVNAVNLSNLGTIFGRTELVLNIEDTLSNGDALVPSNAALFSEGNISIATRDGDRLAQVNNHAGQIESLFGNVSIRADAIRNINLEAAYELVTDVPVYSYSPSKAAFDTFNFICDCQGPREDVWVYRWTDIFSHYVVDQGHRSSIVAAGNILLDAHEIDNEYSSVSAGGVLTLNADILNNHGITLQDDTLRQTHRRKYTCKWSGSTNSDLDCWGVSERLADSHTPGDIHIIPAILEGQAGLVVNADIIVNGEAAKQGKTINVDTAAFNTMPTSAPTDSDAQGGLNLGILDPTLLPGFHLPGNGLFHFNSNPSHPYLIETDPALNTYQGFLGSAYLLDHLNWAPGITQRRLGDSYYEITLIRDALLASIGSRFVSAAISDERTQFEYLMQNAIAASESLQLSPGISLSRAQIDALQQDIVWMEERVVSGERVLVPVVYLAQGSSRILQDGAVIGGGSLDIDSDSFTNSGLVRAHDKVRVKATGAISNLGGTIQAEGDLELRSAGDILNESGHIGGGKVLLRAEGDIVNRTWSMRDEVGSGSNTAWSTRVGDTASVTAAGNLVQIAGGDIRLEAAALAGENISLVAGENITLGTVQIDQGYQFTSSDWQQAEAHVRHLQTQVEAAQSISMSAGADITAIAASINAGGDATLDAGRNINFLAVEESDHFETHSQHDGTVKDKSHDLVHDESRTVGSAITAGGNLRLNAQQGDITLYASTAHADGKADVAAAGNITMMAGVNTTSHSEQSSSSNAATFKNHSEGYIEQTAVASAISSGADLNLNAGKNINLAASTLASDATLRIGETVVDQTALLRPLGEESMGTLPLNLNVSALELTNETWNETQKGLKGPLKELVKAIAFAVAPMLEQATYGLVDMPEINIGSHDNTRTKDVLQAGSTLTAQDMQIRVQNTAAFIGASVNVEGTLAVNAKDIVIDAAAETHSQSHDEGSDTVKGLGLKLNDDEVRVAGVQETKTSLSDTQTLTEWRGTSINAGQLILNAENNIDILGSQLTVVENALIEASGDLTIGGREGEVKQEHKETIETITVAAAVRNAYVDAVLALKAIDEAKDALKSTKEALGDAERKVGLGQLDASDLDYFKVNMAAAAANLAQATISAAASIAVAAATTGTGGFYASGSANRDKTVTTSTSTQSLWQGSTLEVGGSAALAAGNTLTVQGSNVGVADTLYLDAKKIELIAGQERATEKTKTTEEHEGVSVSASSVGVNASYRDTDADSSSLHYVNTHLNAGAIASRSDELRVAGAQLYAGDIAIETNKLAVASLQDESRSKSQTRGVSAGVGTSSVSLGVEKSDSSSSSLWVSEQTQIIGSNSLKIRAKDTTISGAVIANAAYDEHGQLIDQGNLDFQTDTLAVNDLHDISKSKTTGFSLSTSINTGGDKPKAGEPMSGQTTIGGQYYGHEAQQITRATLGGGAIVVGGKTLDDSNADELGLATLNRDLNQAQEITVNKDIGGLNASITVDHRLMTGDGLKDIAKDFRNADNNIAGIGKLTAATVVSATAALASQLGDQDTQAIAVMGNPTKAAQFVKDHPDQAAAIAAYQKGDYDGLLKTKEGLQGLATALGVSVEVLTTDITVKLGMAGTTDDKITALDVTGAHRQDMAKTLGHEVSHNQGIENETLANMAGWAANLGLNAGLDLNNDSVREATKQLGDGKDAATQVQNVSILRLDNEHLVKELADHGDKFENLLSTDQKVVYGKEMKACASLLCKAQVEVKWSGQSVKQDGALVTGFAMGLAQGLGNDISGVASIVKDLPGAINGIAQLINDPEVRTKMGEQMYGEVKDKLDEVKRLLAHGEDAADMTGLGANLGSLTYTVVGYVTLVKGAATAGTKLVANVGKAGGEALDALVKNVPRSPALAVVGGGVISDAAVMAGKPAKTLSSLDKPLLQMTAGTTGASQASELFNEIKITGSNASNNTGVRATDFNQAKSNAPSSSKTELGDQSQGASEDINQNNILALPSPEDVDFRVGERLVPRDIYETYIDGKELFQLGSPWDESFFFNKAGDNLAGTSLTAAVDAGFTAENINNLIIHGGNELIRIRFKLEKVDQISVPGVSSFPGGIGNAPIPGTNELFTGTGKTRTMFGADGINEFIGRNVFLTQEDIISAEGLGKVFE